MQVIVRCQASYDGLGPRGLVDACQGNVSTLSEATSGIGMAHVPMPIVGV